jgi:hypothetical protein
MRVFTEGDTGATVEITILDYKTGAPLNLTASTVSLFYSIGSAKVAERSMTVNGDPTTGKAKYLFASGELVAGQMVAEVVVTNGGKTLTAVDRLAFQISKRLS